MGEGGPFAAGGPGGGTLDDALEQWSRNPLLCWMCEELYEEPCLLACYHTFCARCVRPRLHDAKIVCPLCGYVSLPVWTPGGGGAPLPSPASRGRRQPLPLTSAWEPLFQPPFQLLVSHDGLYMQYIIRMTILVSNCKRNQCQEECGPLSSWNGISWNGISWNGMLLLQSLFPIFLEPST